MLNIGKDSSKYVTFWSAEDKGKYSKVKLSSSTKNKQTDEYETSNWFATFVGHAHNKVNQLSEKDKIEITSGGITKKYVAEKKQEYINVTVFDFEIMGTGGAKPKAKPKKEEKSADFVQVDEDEESLPF